MLREHHRCSVGIITLVLLASACAGGDAGGRSDTIGHSVVRIAGTACLRPILATGIVIGHNRVMTVAHAVAGADDDLSVVTIDGAEHVPRLVAFDPRLDIAVLQVDDLNASPLLPAEASPQDSGVIAAMNRDMAVDLIDYEVLRIVNARSGDIYDEGTVERTALDVRSRASPGTSGAPLVDDEGNYVGMVFAISRDRDDGVYALASAEIVAFLDTVDGAPATDRGRCRG